MKGDEYCQGEDEDQIDENFIFVPVLLFNTIAITYYYKLCRNIQRRVNFTIKM